MNYKKIIIISLILFNISNNFTNYFYNLNSLYKKNIENLCLIYPNEFQVILMLI